MPRKPRRHGWYVGSEDFGGDLLKRLTDVVAGKQRKFYSGKAIQQHDEQQAERIIR